MLELKWRKLKMTGAQISVNTHSSSKRGNLWLFVVVVVVVVVDINFPLFSSPQRR